MLVSLAQLAGKEPEDAKMTKLGARTRHLAGHWQGGMLASDFMHSGQSPALQSGKKKSIVAG